MQELKKKQDALKENFRRPLFFLLNPVPFDRDDNEKKKKSGTTNQLFLWLIKKIRKIALLVYLIPNQF